MQKYFFVDTESIGLYSPTILIQHYSCNDIPNNITRDNVTIHNIWKESVNGSLELIQEICENTIVGFNLAHDWFHLSRTYNILHELYPRNKPPKLLDYHDIENEAICHDAFCLKPKGALDLMLYGRTHEFQATMNQKDIIIRRVPRLLAELLVKELEEKIKIPNLYFAKREGKQLWKIKNLHKDTIKEVTPEEMSNIDKNEIKIDPDFVNLRLEFHPSTGLKPIMKYLLNKDIDLIENMLSLKRPNEFSWYPSSGKWLSVAQDHIFTWSNDKRRINYAKDDVVYLIDLFNYFDKDKKLTNYLIENNYNDMDSVLACMTGSQHWKGFHINLDKIKEQIDVNQKIVNECSKDVNFDSPRQVVQYLKKDADQMESMLIKDSTKETLHILKTDGSPKVRKKAQLIIDGRKARGKLTLLNKLNQAKRLYVTFKVVGTKSNRMSGGSMEDSSYATRKGGSINPQGIKKGDDIRETIIFKPETMVLCGGDFSGYEVSIAEAVFKDENLRKDLLSGRKIHALWGESIYDLPYADILSTEAIPESEPDGYYARSKRSFFAKLYDAQLLKMAEVLQIPEEQVMAGIDKFEHRYPGVALARKKIYEEFSALSQPNGIGTAVIWKEPKKYIESFLGFKRYFLLEYQIIQELFNLANNPTKEMKSVGHLIKVKRRDRTQSASGALQSAVYAAAFSLQAAIIRAALNHEIQSPGGEMTKILEARLWELQPQGINTWLIMLFNVHDEIQAPMVASLINKAKQIVYDFIEEYKKYVPLLKMKWKENLESWGEK